MENIKSPEDQIQQLQNEVRSARQAIRHALQFLKDPSQIVSSSGLSECVANCELILAHEPQSAAAHGFGWNSPKA